VLNLPAPTRIPIGYATVNGQRVEVFLDPEWARYLNSLNTQVADTHSTVGAGPGAPGSTGAAGAAVSFASSDADGSVEFIPGPRGAQGPQGDPGPVVFLMQEPENNDVFWPIRNS
jgi:hypothetical protein